MSIVANRVRCVACRSVVHSKIARVFRFCECGKVAISGGLERLVRLGDRSAYDELSIELPDPTVDLPDLPNVFEESFP